MYAVTERGVVGRQVDCSSDYKVPTVQSGHCPGDSKAAGLSLSLNLHIFLRAAITLQDPARLLQDLFYFILLQTSEVFLKLYSICY